MIKHDIYHKFHRIGEASTMNMVCSSHLQRCQTSIWNVSKKIEMSFIDSPYIFHILYIYIQYIYSIIYIYIYIIKMLLFLFFASKDCCCSYLLMSSPLVSTCFNNSARWKPGTESPLSFLYGISLDTSSSRQRSRSRGLAMQSRVTWPWVARRDNNWIIVTMAMIRIIVDNSR